MRINIFPLHWAPLGVDERESLSLLLFSSMLHNTYKERNFLVCSSRVQRAWQGQCKVYWGFFLKWKIEKRKKFSNAPPTFLQCYGSSKSSAQCHELEGLYGVVVSVDVSQVTLIWGAAGEGVFFSTRVHRCCACWIHHGDDENWLWNFRFSFKVTLAPLLLILWRNCIHIAFAENIHQQIIPIFPPSSLNK